MRAGLAALFFSMFVISVSLRGAYDPLLGSWKLNRESPQTRYSPGYPAPKSQTVKFEAAGADEVKCTTDTEEADGKLTHVEYTARLDGKDYPVKGDLNRDTVAWKRVKPFVTEGVSKKAGEVTSTFSILIWGNGLLMTITSKETRDGKTYENVAVYNKVLP